MKEQKILEKINKCQNLADVIKKETANFILEIGRPDFVRAVGRKHNGTVSNLFIQPEKVTINTVLKLINNFIKNKEK